MKWWSHSQSVDETGADCKSLQVIGVRDNNPPAKNRLSVRVNPVVWYQLRNVLLFLWAGGAGLRQPARRGRSGGWYFCPKDLYESTRWMKTACNYRRPMRSYGNGLREKQVNIYEPRLTHEYLLLSKWRQVLSRYYAKGEGQYSCVT